MCEDPRPPRQQVDGEGHQGRGALAPLGAPAGPMAEPLPPRARAPPARRLLLRAGATPPRLVPAT
eukprot:1179845-Prorocentrum_minimum.AAC.3